MSVLNNEVIDSLEEMQEHVSYSNYDDESISDDYSSCRGTCSGSCSGDCDNSCAGTCDSGCSGGCEYSCSGSCEFISGL